MCADNDDRYRPTARYALELTGTRPESDLHRRGKQGAFEPRRYISLLAPDLPQVRQRSPTGGPFFAGGIDPGEELYIRLWRCWIGREMSL